MICSLHEELSLSNFPEAAKSSGDRRMRKESMKVPLVDSPGTIVLPNPAGSVLSVEQCSLCGAGSV